MTILTNCLLQDFHRKKTNSVYIALAVHCCMGFFYLRQKCDTNASLIPVIGELRFDVNDVDRLYKYIQEA